MIAPIEVTTTDEASTIYRNPIAAISVPAQGRAYCDLPEETSLDELREVYRLIGLVLQREVPA